MVLGGKELALNVKGDVDGRMSGKESLRQPGALAQLHLDLSPSGWLMRVLGSIVVPFVTFVTALDLQIGTQDRVSARRLFLGGTIVLLSRSSPIA
jgi:hypothetical protein